MGLRLDESLASSSVISRLDEQLARQNMYFAGVVDGLNNAYKVINSIDDDYNLRD